MIDKEDGSSIKERIYGISIRASKIPWFELTKMLYEFYLKATRNTSSTFENIHLIVFCGSNSPYANNDNNIFKNIPCHRHIHLHWDMCVT